MLRKKHIIIATMNYKEWNRFYVDAYRYRAIIDRNRLYKEER